MLSLTYWMSKLPFDAIRQVASQFEIDALLLVAMIIQESGGEKCAMRFESQWEYVWKPVTFAKMAKTSQMTEVIGQKISWGPMQIMGTVAREQGFHGPFPELCDFSTGTYYGAKVLSSKLKDYKDIPDAISAYNMGTPKKWKSEIEIDSYMTRQEKLGRKHVKRPRVGDYYNQYYVDHVLEYWTQLGGA